MKKFKVLLLTLTLAVAMIGCAKTPDASQDAQVQPTDAPVATQEPTAEPVVTEAPVADDAKSEGVMTYEEYAAAALDSEVVIEAYVQAKQSWWDDNGQGKVTVYAQDEDGAYFLYEMKCTAEEDEKLVPGTKIKVTGYKAEWAGEVEIMDATFEILEGNYVAEALDVTDLLGTDELINHQNKFVAFKGMTVEAANDAGDAYLYKWDGSGQDGDDLYFNVSYNGATYSFVVESYLCDNTTDVYAAVKNLKVGDVVDMEGFLYWYEGVNPHITSVTVSDSVAVEQDVKSEGVMTYAEYAEAALDSEVVIEAYVQAKQSWWEDNGQGKVTVYAQDKDGAYFLYEMACTAEDNEKLGEGTKIKVTGYKAEWAGEVEIMDATFEILDGYYVADAFDATSLLGTDDLIKHQNEKVAFKGMTVEAANDAGDAFLYKWDGSGQDGDDLYFNVSYNGTTYSFVVESYLCDNTTDVYAAVKNLKVGDVVDMEGFLYWYEGVNPHITSVTVK